MFLNETERGLLAGESGQAAAFAMQLLVEVANSVGATRFVEIEQAHIDGCLYHAPAPLDFAEFLVKNGGRVSVPTTLNISSLDLLHPDLYRGDPAQAAGARALMDAHVAMGCEPTWTCAPYQLASRPERGQHIAWGESNAIVFANSVIGARTGRYGDFMDMCCAIAGRAPFSGLHTDEGRIATFRIGLELPDAVLGGELLYPVLGHMMGRSVGQSVPVIDGLDDRADEDRLKALGAAAAASGTVGMFHVAGVTPEAPTLADALGGRTVERSMTVRIDDLNEARDGLDRGSGPLGAVSVGTPHASLAELTSLDRLARGRSSSVPFYVNTSRAVAGQASDAGLLDRLVEFGVTLITDTCTYSTHIMEPVSGDVMTNSGKWAYYAPGNLGVGVRFGSLADCVESAVAGNRVVTGDWS